MAFLSRALKNTEVFLEQFDDRVAEVSRRIALQNAALSANAIDAESKSTGSLPPGARSSTESHRRPRNTQPSQTDPAVLVREGEAMREELQQLRDNIEERKSSRTALAKALNQATTILADLEASLKFRTQETRDLRDALDREKDRAEAADIRANKEAVATQSKLETLRRDGTKESTKLARLMEQKVQQVDQLTEINAATMQTLRDQRKLDLESAGQARREALQALEALEEEVSAHNASRHRSKVREEALEASAAEATTALARAERRAEEARAGAIAILEAAREIEWKVKVKSESRNKASETVETLERELQQFEDSRDHKAAVVALAKLREKMESITGAIEKRDMEIQRLESDMTSIQEARRRAAGQSLNLTSIDVVQSQLNDMAAATSRKEATLDLVRGENKALLHQLLSERKKNREAQALAAGRTQGPAWDDPMERGDLTNVVSLWRSGDGVTTKLRVPRQLSWWPAAQTAVAGLDRVSVVVVAVLRKEAPLRLGIVCYVAMLHIVLYLLFHFGWWGTVGEPILGQGRGPPGLAGLG